MTEKGGTYIKNICERIGAQMNRISCTKKMKVFVKSA